MLVSQDYFQLSLIILVLVTVGPLLVLALILLYKKRVLKKLKKSNQSYKSIMHTDNHQRVNGNSSDLTHNEVVSHQGIKFPKPMHHPAN